jgi:TPR repeat protein
MAMFRRKGTLPVPPPAPPRQTRRTDGTDRTPQRANPPDQKHGSSSASHDRVAASDSGADLYVDKFLESLARQNPDSALSATQGIFAATPSSVYRGTNYLERPWRWLSDIASSSDGHGEFSRAAKIALLCQIWNRMILKEDSRLQMGRLVQAPLETEMEIYRSGLRSLIRLPADLELVPQVGDEGWSVAQALDQISQCITLLEDEGISIPIELQSLAAADPHLVKALRPDAATDGHGGTDDSIERLHSSAEKAESSDAANVAYMRAGAILLSNGDPEDALEQLEDAARLGHVDAMYDAGGQCLSLGNVGGARFWWEAAANGGRADAAWNLAATAYDDGDIVAAMEWYKTAADLGDSRGFAALTQIASDSEDTQSEFEFASKGAEAGDLFCLVHFGELVAMRAEGKPSELARALKYLEQAAGQGDTEGMVSASMVRGELGQRHEAMQWLLRAKGAGHPRAGELLDEYFT